jgi:hypothetical protein
VPIRPPAGRAFTVVRVLLGLLLLTAASLKLTAAGVETFEDAGLLSFPAVRAVLIGVEALLGLWLLAGGNNSSLWLTALVFFSALLAVSVYSGLRGQRSCGCLGGRISMSPWYAALVDAAALAALVLWRPPDLNRRAAFTLAGLRPLLLAAGGAVALVTAMLGAAAWVGGGSLHAGLLRLRGEPIAIEPATLDLGDAPPGSTVKHPVQVINYADHTVRIVGGKSDCSCVTTPDLPLVLSPGESATISVWFRVPPGGGPAGGEYFLYTDDMQFRVVAHYTCPGASRPE